MLENLKTNNFELSKDIYDKKIVILYGGFSSEKDISLISGEEVYRVLKQQQLEVIKYNVTEDISQLVNFLSLLKENIIVFNALHGKFGEDGKLPALLEALSIPYTHSGMLASSIGMNKYLTKQIAKANNILVAKDVLFDIKNITHSASSLEYPIIAKANDEGSSIGVYLVKNQKELIDLSKNELKKYKTILLEEYLPGDEFSVGIVKGKTLDITKILPKNGNEFYNYQAKYTKGGSEHIVSVSLPNDLRNYMLQSSEFIYNLLGCKGISRVDFKEKNGKAYFLEINTHPGFTPQSLLPEQAAYHNISFKNLCLYLLQEAIKQ